MSTGLTRRNLLLSALAASPLASPTFGEETLSIDASPGPHICWVEKVSVERDGVRVLFSASGNNISGVTKSQGRFVIGHNEIMWLSGPKERQTEPGLLLHKHESALLIQGPEDICEVTFAALNGHVGITAHASLTLPSLPHGDKKVFISSQ
jgi:hypothetical protein